MADETERIVASARPGEVQMGDRTVLRVPLREVFEIFDEPFGVPAMVNPTCSECGTTSGPFEPFEYQSSHLCGSCLWGDQPLPLGYEDPS